MAAKANKALRVHVTEKVTDDDLLAKTTVPLHIPLALTDSVPLQDGKGYTVRFKDFLYRNGEYFGVTGVTELKRDRR